MKEKIIKQAYDEGLDLIGFCRPDMEELEPIKKQRQEENLACAFESSYTNVYDIMPDVETVISVALSYPIKSTLNEKIISNSSWGLDYHILLTRRITSLMEKLKEEISDLKYMILVDNHPLSDKYYAYKAGFGFIGKNNLLINETYGSNIFLGTILINKYIKEDQVKNNLCGSCTICLDSCPTKAINDSGKFNANKCRSYLTQKKELTIKEEKEIKLIYGCDICGSVCPYNKDNHKHKELEADINLFDKLNEVSKMSNRKFKEQFKNYGFSWRGKKIILRNLNLIKKNK